MLVRQNINIPARGKMKVHQEYLVTKNIWNAIVVILLNGRMDNVFAHQNINILAQENMNVHQEHLATINMKNAAAPRHIHGVMTNAAALRNINTPAQEQVIQEVQGHPATINMKNVVVNILIVGMEVAVHVEIRTSIPVQIHMKFHIWNNVKINTEYAAAQTIITGTQLMQNVKKIHV